MEECILSFFLACKFMHIINYQNIDHLVKMDKIILYIHKGRCEVCEKDVPVVRTEDEPGISDTWDACLVFLTEQMVEFEPKINHSAHVEKLEIVEDNLSYMYGEDYYTDNELIDTTRDLLKKVINSLKGSVIK